MAAAVSSSSLSASSWLFVLALAFVSGAATLVGAFAARKLGRRPRAIAIGIGFSTGVMLCIALFDLFPEAVRLSSPTAAGVSAAIAVAVMVTLHWLLPHIHIVPERGALGLRMRQAMMVAVGLVLHDIAEGFALANSFVVAPALGVWVAGAIALHNVPEEFAVAVPVVHSGRRGLLAGTLTASALAEPLGAAVGLLLLGLATGLHGPMLAFAAGAMCQVSIHELLPLARSLGHAGAFAVGAVVAVATYGTLSLLVSV